MKRRSLFVATAIAILFLHVSISYGQQTNTLPNGAQYIEKMKSGHASRTPQVGEYLGLSASLTNAIVRTDNSIELDFVLHNGSNMPIRLAERWNSWGAYQWRFRVVDAKRTVYELENPQVVWHANALTTFAIAPSEDQITRCRLDMSTTKHSEDKTAIFSLPVFDSQVQRTNRWVFPVDVTGIFSASTHTNTWTKTETTWEGSIATEPLVVAK
jgi:hypothetical protein